MSGKVAILREHDTKVFNIALNGLDIYELTQRLMADARHEELFTEISKCVHLVEKVSDQAREQGFALPGGARNDYERAAGIYPTRQ
jgi:hypothetical protein